MATPLRSNALRRFSSVRARCSSVTRGGGGKPAPDPPATELLIPYLGVVPQHVGEEAAKVLHPVVLTQVPPSPPSPRADFPEPS